MDRLVVQLICSLQFVNQTCAHSHLAEQKMRLSLAGCQGTVYRSTSLALLSRGRMRPWQAFSTAEREELLEESWRFLEG